MTTIKNRSSIIIFMAVTFLFWLALYIYVPTLPTYIKTKTEHLSMVGLVLSMYGLSIAFVRLPIGIFGDMAGRGRPLIILCFFFASVGAIIMSKGNTLFMLAVGRAFTGISMGSWVLLLGTFSTFFDFKQTIFASSMLTFSASFGRMIGTGLTGFLNRRGGYPLAFYLSAILVVIALVIILFVKDEKKPPKTVSIRTIGNLLIRKEILLPTIISIIVHHVEISATYGFLPILAHKMGANDVIKSMLVTLNIAAITSANLLNTFLLRKKTPDYMLPAGAFLMFLGIMILAFSPSITYLFIGSLCNGLSFGIVYPILVGKSIRKIDRSQRSTAMGLHQSMYAIGMFTGPWLSGILADRFGIRPMFMINAGAYIVLVYFFIYLFFRGNIRQNKTTHIN
ncbi:MAG TPA: MFS transporter [Spirochaetes bacterium]|nr:MFS transporter [Spirochaetota bacterium]